MLSSYIISIIVLVFVFYHLLYNPEKKKWKKRQEMLKTMKIGDVVLTTGDFYGVVVDITGENVIVRFGGENKGCCILMKKSAIAEVTTAEE
ncbi:MAG: preprotein translocase subunit YajC [Firmicutes bacterium]|nr:preprotein translocase subunit YajC [Bacillota bacterium]